MADDVNAKDMKYYFSGEKGCNVNSMLNAVVNAATARINYFSFWSYREIELRP